MVSLLAMALLKHIKFNSNVLVVMVIVISHG